jgi:AraC-like DNA-binding protein
VYTEDQLRFLEAHRGMKRADLAALFNATFGTALTFSHITQACTRRGWTTRRGWKEEEDTVIRSQYADTKTADVAASLNRSPASIYQRAYELGLNKSAAFLSSEASGRLRGGRGVQTRFSKGHVPANKGMHRPGYAPGRMAETQFGKKPVWNHQPIGATRIDGEGYEWTKVQDLPKVRTDVNWTATHILRWEAIHGPVPKGHALKCLDGNRRNTDPANWICIERGMLARLNGGVKRKRFAYDQAPAELKPVLLQIAHLQHTAKRRKEKAA